MFSYTIGGMSQADLLILLLFVAIAGVVMGFLTDALMRQQGFGPLGNGLIVTLGGVIGVYYRGLVFGPAAAQHSYAIAFSAVGAATLILLTVGIAKRFLKG